AAFDDAVGTAVVAAAAGRIVGVELARSTSRDTNSTAKKRKLDRRRAEGSRAAVARSRPKQRPESPIFERRGGRNRVGA
ncbi:MAG TPA: hypothetical protein VGC30_06390, partial [Dokdonella sp.]